MCAVSAGYTICDAINVLMYLVVVTLLFQLLAKHSSAASMSAIC